jgi:putative transposase
MRPVTPRTPWGHCDPGFATMQESRAGFLSRCGRPGAPNIRPILAGPLSCITTTSRSSAPADPPLGPLPSYTPVRRYMKAQRLLKQPPLRDHLTPGAQTAAHRLQPLEVRSFEIAYVHGLWHLDFHHASRKVLTPSGTWVIPLLLGVLDECSRLACHVQGYLEETAQNLVHGLCQAFQKRALPRALMTDNGSAMLAEEVRQGLHDLSIRTRPPCPIVPLRTPNKSSSGRRWRGV